MPCPPSGRSPFRLSTLKLFFLALLAPASPAFADLWAISTDASYSRVIRMDNNGVEKVGAGIPSFSAGLVAPGGIAVGPDGTIYVSSRGTNQILSYTCGATSCAPKGLPGHPAGEFAALTGAAPAQLKFGPNGNLFVSELAFTGGQNVRVYNPSTGAQLPNAASGVPGPGGLAFETDGSLLVGAFAVPEEQNPLGFPIPSMIMRFTQGQANVPFFVDSDGSQQFPSSLAFLPNGDMVGVDLVADKLWRYIKSGNSRLKFAFGDIPPIMEGKPNFPSDIVFDPDGNLILAVLGPNNPGDEGGNQGQLLRYSVEGHLIQTIGSQLEQIGALAWTASPATLAGDFNNDGDVDNDDYLKWKGDFGKFVATANGADGNGNGVVDAGDYTIWRDQLTTSGAAALSTVPEPAAALLAVLGICLACGTRRIGLT